MNYPSQQGGKQGRKSYLENVEKEHDRHMSNMVKHFVGWAIIIFLIFLATN